MSIFSSTISQITKTNSLLPDLPLVVWMVLVTIVLGFASGDAADQLVSIFNVGFGRALGEFALILLPSFTLAAALARQNATSEAVGKTAALASPFAGAGMICPDTAYAALAPAAGRHKLSLAFGAFAGFKLLYPAGPLIVAAGLGVAGTNVVEPTRMMLVGLGLTLPVWIIGVLWARIYSEPTTPKNANLLERKNISSRLLITFSPFILMGTLLTLGGFIRTGVGVIDFLLLPKGALFASAALSLTLLKPEERRESLDSGVYRTGSLLLLIGAASAFGAVITSMVSFEILVPSDNGIIALVALFVLTVVFKLAQGSSMATFAAVAPFAAPIVATIGVAPIAAVFAICIGSFVAILPNDSYYWLVRRDALEKFEGESAPIRILTGGSIVQALLGMAILLAGATVLG